MSFNKYQKRYKHNRANLMLTLLLENAYLKVAEEVMGKKRNPKNVRVYINKFRNLEQKKKAGLKIINKMASTPRFTDFISSVVNEIIMNEVDRDPEVALLIYNFNKVKAPTKGEWENFIKDVNREMTVG